MNGTSRSDRQRDSAGSGSSSHTRAITTHSQEKRVSPAKPGDAPNQLYSHGSSSQHTAPVSQIAISLSRSARSSANPRWAVKPNRAPIGSSTKLKPLAGQEDAPERRYSASYGEIGSSCQPKRSAAPSDRSNRAWRRPFANVCRVRPCPSPKQTES